MKICIGMISYLPENNMRSKRIESLQNLFNKLDELFPELPVLIVTQSWRNYRPATKLKLNMENHSSALGIINARIRLREMFLNSEYDYMIMLDDDCIINGSDASDYIKEIEDHPDGFGWFSNHLLKLFAISKNIYSQIEMPKVEAEKFEGFEDKLFISMCRIRFPEHEFEFSHDKLTETSYQTHETPSTWWNSEAAKNRQAMRDKTDELIRKYMKEYNNTTFIIPGSKEDIKAADKKKDSSVDFDAIMSQGWSINNEELTEKVDIVVTYVNNQDRNWQEMFNYWKDFEKNDAKEQTSSDIRFRDTGTFKYFFRGIEKNCKWVNKVFLIVQSKDQIPDWMDVNCSKLRIVFHDEYIPKELLPTFNSNTIEMFLSNIEDLSNNYILCNDDTFFINRVSETMFYDHNKPVYSLVTQSEIKPISDFFTTLCNNKALLREELNSDLKPCYWHAHLQMPHKKPVEKFILGKHYNKIFDSLKSSKFRSTSNYTPWLYDDYIKYGKIGVNNPGLYTGSKNVTLNDSIDYRPLRAMKLLCVNDTSNTKNFEKASRKLNEFLESKFPLKSVFEK